MNDITTTNIPVARMERVARTRWVWLIPLLAAGAALVLIGMYVVKRGPIVTVTMRHGYGLKAGDVVRSLGVVVGQVEDVRLTQGPEGLEVQVAARLEPSAREVARGGSRFWVVRPTVSLAGVAGLETIAGPRYLAVIPGAGERQNKFVALDEPPVVEEVEPNGLEIILTAERRGSLRPGSPLMYRQVVIGTILSVGLAGDAAGVEVRAYIRPAFANIVRGKSVFWNASGVGFQASFQGLRFDLESLQSLVEGGVAMATPNDPGPPVHTGHRFALLDEPEGRDWKPALAVGSALLPAGAARPDMQRVTINRRTGLFKTQRKLTGWALPTAEGLIGPADLLEAGKETTQLEVAGQSFELAADGPQSPKVRPLSNHQLAILELAEPKARSWPADRTRSMETPEDCLIVADPSGEPIPLPAIRLTKQEGGWRIDPSVSFDDSLHGAAVMARSDGQVVGLLIVRRGAGQVAAPLR